MESLPVIMAELDDTSESTIAGEPLIVTFPAVRNTLPENIPWFTVLEHPKAVIIENVMIKIRILSIVLPPYLR